MNNQLLNQLRLDLLHLHKSLIDLERTEYEWRHGKIAATAFLRLLTSDPAFAWLRFLSELIVRIDEALDSGEERSEDDQQDLIDMARKLLDPDTINPEFAQKYRDALQKEPAAVLAHQRLRQTLAG